MSYGGTILEALQNTARSLRSYVTPSHLAVFRELRKHSELPDGKIALFDFTDVRIDSVMGRYLHHIVRDFNVNGYAPVFVDNFGFLATGYKKKYKAKLFELPFAVVSGPEQLERPFVYVTDRKDAKLQTNAELTVFVDYTKRRAVRSNEVELPLFAHPKITESNELPPQFDGQDLRPVRVFFAGNTNPRTYGRSTVSSVYGMLSRAEILNAVREHFATADTATSMGQIENLPENELLLIETQHHRIPPERWLDTMKQADFFLACPGTVMPLCHNLVEALSCGTIPILQYHQYLNPELRDGENCITFHDLHSLSLTVQRALDMSRDEILRMRASAREYYDRYFTEGAFASRLLEHESKNLTLLMNAYRIPIQKKI